MCSEAGAGTAASCHFWSEDYCSPLVQNTTSLVDCNTSKNCTLSPSLGLAKYNHARSSKICLLFRLKASQLGTSRAIYVCISLYMGNWVDISMRSNSRMFFGLGSPDPIHYCLLRGTCTHTHKHIHRYSPFFLLYGQPPQCLSQPAVFRTSE